MKHYMQRTENNITTNYPPASLQELNHWIQRVTESGFLKEQEEKGVTFKIVEESNT